jgi:glycosyltransferase involved in cell wall biosynthesis
MGHQVTLLTGPPLGPEGSLLERARAGGYRVELIDEMRRSILPGKDWRTFGRLTARLRELAPDVVHTHSSKAGVIGRWAARKAAAPVIIHTIHGLSFTASGSRLVNHAYKALERRAARISDVIVCVADAMRDQSLAAGIGRREQYETVYSGIQTAPFIDPPVPREQTRQRLGLQPHHIAVGTIARLFHLKGHEDLLEIAPGLCRRFTDLRFLWVGDGLLREQFERRIARLGLSDRFILTGLVAPQVVPELTAAMDAVVHPSRREGLARALAQGSLAAKPVITYDIDGAKEAVMHGQTGFVIPPFNTLKLSQALAVLLDDAALRHTMGQAGRQFAVRRFDAAVMVDALERIYQSRLARRAR